MASQFTGTDKANLLSTALTEDSGDNIAITATSDAVATGWLVKTPSSLAQMSPASPLRAVKVPTLLKLRVLALALSFKAIRGDDTLDLTGGLTDLRSRVVKENDSIYFEGDLTRASVYGGSGNDGCSFQQGLIFHRGHPFPRWIWSQQLTTTSQTFSNSTVVGGSGGDTV